MRYVLSLALVSLLALPAQAAFEGPGKKDAPVSTIEEAKRARDEARVSLEGTIIEKVGDEKYTFKDPTGSTIIVEIDDKVFEGRRITPETRIRIYGEVDHGLLRNNEIEVKRIELLDR